MYQNVHYNKQLAKNNKASFSHQKASIKNPIIDKPKIRVSMPSVFFLDLKIEKSLKIWDLGDELFYYIKSFIQFKKNGQNLC